MKKTIKEIESMIDENSIVITLPNGEIRSITANDYEKLQNRIKQLEDALKAIEQETKKMRERSWDDSCEFTMSKSEMSRIIINIDMIAEKALESKDE